MKPWIYKYIPESPEKILGQDLSQIISYLANHKTKKKALIIHGPPGCGKTAAAYAIGKENDLEIVEVNASDFRNKERIKSTVGASASQMSLFSKGKLILLDEIDGLSGMKDRGGVAAISELIDKSAFPILMTCNNPWDKKFNSLRKKSTLVEFKPLDLGTVTKILTDIAKKEGVKIPEEKIRSLARREGGDLRAAITDLQTLSMLGEIGDIDELSERNRTETMKEALTKVFKTTDPDVAIGAFDNVDENLDQILLWMDENLPKEYTRPKDLARAYHAVSNADLFKGRIMRWQYWRYMVYVYQFLSAGVALSKEERYKGLTDYKPTTRIFKIWQANMKNRRRKAIAQKIADATHTSSKVALESTLPYIQNIFRNKKEQDDLVQELDLDKDDEEWLRK